MFFNTFGYSIIEMLFYLIYDLSMERNNKIIGREYEQKLIKQSFESNNSELIAVYGRRRIGKTFLIKNVFNENFDFWFTGMYETSRSTQLRQFGKELSKYSKNNYDMPKDWFEAFDKLKDFLLSLNKKKIIVFLDELPWIDTQKSNFLSAFSYFWNMWASEKCILKLYVCGSATTWMLDKFVGDKGGLYGRVTRAIYLAPFSLGETEQFLKKIKKMNITRKQIAELYMIMGGIPYYLSMIDKDLPISKNIDNLFFANGALLKNEFDFLFRSLFRESNSYKKVIEILSKKLKGMTREEILTETKITGGGTLSKILDNLCTCDFIRKYSAFGKKEKDCMYQLTDLFSLFYLRFVQKNSSQDENFWSNMTNTGEKNSWSGYAFEQVCLHHIWQIKNKLGINGVLSNICSWDSKPFTDSDGTKWSGGQIDLLIDRKDDVINICEMKFVGEEYVINEAYEKKLRERISLFKHITKTRKAVNCTFVTTFGIKQNTHSDIVSTEIILEDLFENK